MPGAVLDHHVAGADQALFAVVEFQPQLAFEQYPVVDGRGLVHARVVRLETLEQPG
ncbi:hypothetical protein D3C72_2390510 [compost metagenome]